MSSLDAAVIIAGGGGTRLWPWTSNKRPKPLLPLGGGGRTLLSATVDRLSGPIATEKIYLQATAELGRRLQQQEPRIRAENVKDEPSARDTAPAIALAMRRLLAQSPEAVVAIVPADHRVEDVAGFQQALEAAGAVAQDGSLVLLGVKPSHPSTSFGYLRCTAAGSTTSTPSVTPTVLSVESFEEKPNGQTAQQYVNSGSYLWNAGLFIWRADVFWQSLERYAPGVADAVDRYARTGESSAWEAAPKTSIDYALMEKADGVKAISLDCGWSDVGSWEAVCELAERGEAGPATVRRPAGPSGNRSILIAIECPMPAQAISLSDQPSLTVLGPEGVLVAPLAELDQLRRFVGRG